jgi:hypothetical protein
LGDEGERKLKLLTLGMPAKEQGKLKAFTIRDFAMKLNIVDKK